MLQQQLTSLPCILDNRSLNMYHRRYSSSNQGTITITVAVERYSSKYPYYRGGQPGDVAGRPLQLDRVLANETYLFFLANIVRNHVLLAR